MKKIICQLLALAAGTTAFAQAINIDVGLNALYPLPAATFGAAAGAGTWNSVSPSPGVSGALVNLSGGATTVTTSNTAGGSFEFNNALTNGDDQNLMDDSQDPGASSTWTFSGVAPGNYKLYTYAWAPDSAAYRSLVTVTGSSDPAQLVGGTFPGPNTYVAGITHALHHVTVGGAGTISMTITVGTSFATLNGFQLVPDPAAVAFCEPGVAGVLACQCGNPNGAGVGCGNTGSSGASIASAGTANLAGDATDPGVFSLTGNSMLSGGSCIFLQGDGIAPGGSVTFGAGIRCAGGQLFRLYVKPITAGSATGPVAGDRSISNRSSDLGTVITPGSTRYYQIYYRDPGQANPGGGCPLNDTFNITTGLTVVWN